MFKVKIMSVIFLILIVLFQVSSVLAEPLESFDLVHENRHLQLYMDYQTTEIAVYCKETDRIWYSNPPGREEQETIARGRTRDRLSSQLQISFYTPGDRQRFMNNYTDSILIDQFDIQRLENGVRIDYQLGAIWQEEQYIPIMISQSRMEEKILQKIEEGDRELVSSMYYSVKLVEKPEDYERFDVYGVDKEEVFGDYTMVTEEELSERDRQRFFNNLFTRIVDNREEYSEFEDVTGEDIIHFSEEHGYILRDRLASWDLEDLIDVLQKAEYTPWDVIEDHLANNLNPPQRSIRVFDIPLEYRLERDTLVVSIPADEINYPIDALDPDRDGLRSTMPLVRIRVLENFGAADKTEQGYMFVPDGSGALIYLNNEKTGSPAYSQDLYGRELSSRPREEMRSHQNDLHLPVFGLTNEQQAWLAVIEEGAAIGRIEADISGRTNSYNTVNASFNTIPQAQVSLSGHLEDHEQRFMNVYQSRSYKGNISVRYHFLDESEADYVGMAHTYQDYLENRGQIEQLEPVDNIPFMLEILGSIHKRGRVLGVPLRVVESLTTYNQTTEIVDQLLHREIENIILKYTGWFKGGTEHNFPGNYNLESAVGTREELIALESYLRNHNIPFYPEIGFQYLYNNKLFDGFRARRDGARFINRRTAYVSKYNMANYQVESGDRKYILSPGRLEQTREDFMSGYESLEIENLALRHIGQHLNSDYRYRTDRLIDRPSSEELIVEHLRELTGSYDLNLMLKGSNAYTLPFSNILTDMPLQKTPHNIIDRGIPFMQIVLHGYYNYSGQPINLTAREDNFLKILETGALPYFKWIYEPSDTVKHTPFSEYYSLHYGEWIENAADYYHSLNDVLQEVHHLPIVEHKKIQDNVYLTGFQNGREIIVNYSSNKVEYKGEEISAGSYLVREGGAE